MIDTDSAKHKTHWICEKWSEEAVEFVRDKLYGRGINIQIGGYQPVPTNRVNKMASVILGRPVLEYRLQPLLIKVADGVTSENMRAYMSAEVVEEIEGNLLLNEGIQRLEDLLIVAGGQGYDNTHSYIGVGDSNTAESASQTDLQAASNHFYKVMNATYPSRSSQTVSFQADFTSAEANFHWQEWTISAGATSASGSGFLIGTTNLNRKVSDLGTKATGTWTLTGQVTIS